MATLYVTEYMGVAQTQIGGSYTPIANTPAITEQAIAIGGSSTASAAFNGQTTLIRVHADSVCSIEIGTAPTATVTTARMAANQTEYFGVDQGTVMKIAVIANT